MADKNDTEKCSKYLCKTCGFKCSKNSNLTAHFSTHKHLDAVESLHLLQKKCLTYLCSCGVEYTHRQSLFRHKKKCKQINPPAESNDSKQDVSLSQLLISNETLIEILKQNQEFKELIVEQNKQNNDQNKENHELTKKIMELSTTTINNTTNNTQNKFNMNVFLNETCKDALNLNDFVKSLQITTADFERFGKNGFVEGISNIMLKGLNKLDVCKRPIHCTDLKRETIHLKEDNIWEKVTDDRSKLKKVIKQIKHKNIDCADTWKEENPEYKDCQSKVHERYMKIINESMGGYDNEEDEVFYNKIIKNVAKEVTIKKTEAL